MNTPIFTKSIVSGSLPHAMSYIYNYEDPNGIFLIDKKTLEAFQQLDGTKTLEDVIMENNLNSEDFTLDYSLMREKGFFTDCERKKESTKIREKTYDVWFHITNECNLNCSYCYINKSAGCMPMDLAYSYIDSITAKCNPIEKNTINIRFAGGEPLLRINDIKELVKYCNERYTDIHFTYNIITNGILLNDRNIDFLLNNRFMVGVSMDGPEQYHNLTRLNHSGFNSFKLTLESVERAINARLPISILTTVSEVNLGGIVELTGILSDMNIPFRYSLERGLSEFPHLANKQEDLIQTFTECFSVMRTKMIEGKTRFNFQLNDIKFDKKHLRSCGAGNNTFAAGFDGQIGLCGMGLEKPIGNIQEGNPYDLVQKKSHNLMDYTVDQVPECANCKWKYSCASGCPIQNYYLFGMYNHVSPYCKFLKAIMPAYLQMKAERLLYRNIGSVSADQTGM